MEQEVKEVWRADKILRLASAFSSKAVLDH